ncbi:MAG: non-canonical purine NTP pyrophosphatase, partial [Candidatus Paceibacteria bacterium]
KAMLGSAVAYAFPDGTADVVSHRVEGTIAHQEQWDETQPAWIAPQPDDLFGGGFNAIFIPEGASRTLAQIPPEEAIPWSYREYTFSTMLHKLSDMP